MGLISCFDGAFCAFRKRDIHYRFLKRARLASFNIYLQMLFHIIFRFTGFD